MDIRDRTAEFQQSVVTYKKLNKSRNKAVVEEAALAKPKQSEFQRNASLIAHDISETAQLLSKLAILAKRKPMFNDNPVEIAELSFLIKRKIYSVEQQLMQLSQQIHGPNTQLPKSAAGHSNNVMNLLNRKMKNISGDFKIVLEERQRLEMSNRDRWDKLSENVAPGAAADGNRTGSPAGGNDASGTANTSMNIGYNSSNPFMSSLMDEEQDKQAQAASGANGQALMLPDSDSQLLMMEEGLTNNEYLQERNRAVETIETTIQEVGNLFQQLASMVQEQGEVIQRIDANVDDVDMNISGAQRELLKYFDRVKSNRWLAVKIFFIIFAFFLVWVLVN